MIDCTRREIDSCEAAAQLTVVPPAPLPEDDEMVKILTSFHAEEYVQHVQESDVDVGGAGRRMKRCRSERAFGATDSDEDDADFGFADARDASVDGATSHSSCPPFPGMWRTACSNVWGTLTAARKLLAADDATTRVAIFPAGGRHHAKRDRADGFCIFNDVVIAALELQRDSKQRGKQSHILIVDIDAHHGDGTEEAFRFDTNVTCLSMHAAGVAMYPGTGGQSIGNALNVPLPPMAQDELAVPKFRDAFKSAVKSKAPTHCILVAGTDAISGDPYGSLRLTMRGIVTMIADVVQKCEDDNIPLLITGAGGYVDTTTSIVWRHILKTICCGCGAKDVGGDVPTELAHFKLYKPHNFRLE